MRLKFSLLLFISFLFAAVPVFARAGGGSGGGAVAGGLAKLMGMLLGLVVLYIIYRKNKKAKKLIAVSHEKDALWDYDAMVTLAKEVFMNMQQAWMERNVDTVKDIITEKLYADYAKKLHWQITKKEQNILDDINIKRVSIIGEEDHLDKEQDCFTVYLSGTMIDYSVYERTGMKEGSETKAEPFSDLYYFVRQDNKWLLDRIDNEVSISKLVKAKQIIE